MGKPCHYCDGTLSREVGDDDEQDDWEATGQDEMNELHDKCTSGNKVLNARDHLCELADLVKVCIEALSESKLKDIKRIVTDTLYFHVLPGIERIEKELAKP